MAAPAVSGRWAVPRRARALAALVLLAAAFAVSPPRPASAAGDQKVWRALTDGEQRDRARPAAQAGRAGAPASSSRDYVPGFVAVGFVVAVFAGIVIAALSSARRVRKAATRSPAFDLDTGSDLERVWSQHLKRKKRERGAPV